MVIRVNVETTCILVGRAMTGRVWLIVWVGEDRLQAERTITSKTANDGIFNFFNFSFIMH